MKKKKKKKMFHSNVTEMGRISVLTFTSYKYSLSSINVVQYHTV